MFVLPLNCKYQVVYYFLHRSHNDKAIANRMYMIAFLYFIFSLRYCDAFLAFSRALRSLQPNIRRSGRYAKREEFAIRLNKCFGIQSSTRSPDHQITRAVF